MSTTEGSNYSVSQHSAPRGLTWQNVNVEETREARRRKKKGKTIIAVFCGITRASAGDRPSRSGARATSSAVSFRPPVIESWHWAARGGARHGPRSAIFDPATYRAGRSASYKLAVLIAWIRSTICKCAQNEKTFVFRRKLASRLFLWCN